MSDPNSQAPLRTVDDQTHLVKVWLVVGLIIAVSAWFAFGHGDDESSGVGGADVTSRNEITDHVTGSAASVDITIETPTGTSQQSANVPMTNKGGPPAA